MENDNKYWTLLNVRLYRVYRTYICEKSMEFWNFEKGKAVKYEKWLPLLLDTLYRTFGGKYGSFIAIEY